MSDVVVAPNGVTARAALVSAFVRRAHQAGIFHLLLSSASVQGLAYLAQMGMARLLSPAEFGVVRTTEAAISILAVVGGFGMPSLAIKAIAQVEEPRTRARLLGALLSIALICTGCIVMAVLVVAPHFARSGFRVYLQTLTGLIVLIALNRTCQNYFQGIRAFQRIAVISILLTVVSLSLLLFLVKIAGLHGWIAGRYLAEGLFLIALLSQMKGRITLRGALPARYPALQLVSLGAPICMGLLLRAALDNAGLFAMGLFHRPRPELGVCGLALLIGTAAMMLPAAVSAIYLPRLSAAASDPLELRRMYREMRRLGLILGGGLTIFMLLISPLVPLVFGAAYRPATLPIAILSLDMLPSILAAYSASVLLARDRAYLSAGLNLLLAGLAAVLYYLLIPRYGTVGTVSVVVILDWIGMLYLMMMVEREGGWRSLPRQEVTG